MKFKKTAATASAVLSIALLASGCSSSGGSSAGGDGKLTSSSPDSAFITVNGSEPQNPLIPTNTNEVGGGKILDMVFSGLVYYDAKGAVHNDVAESITSDDNITWTIKLKKDRKFSDGTPVQAHNFTEAWEAGYVGDHLSSYFFEPIEGYALNDAGERATDALTGLKVVDDYTFTVKLQQAEADFPLRLGYSAFYPLPDSTLKDPKAGGQFPVGNGPYQLSDKKAWKHKVQISLVPSKSYNGPLKAKNDGIRVKFYETPDAGYQDLLGGKLDVLDALPDSAFSTYKQELKGRNFNQPAAIFQSFAIPERLEHFGGEEGKLRRQAISMAINRPLITKTIFQGTRTPATDFTSPVIDGFSKEIPGNEVLSYDAKKAKELWAKADEISPYNGTFTIGYNSDGGHQGWVDAVTGQLRKVLGIQAEGKPYADFKSLRDDVTNRTIAGAFRTGWQADYPGLYNFLAPLYATGAGSNDGDYSNPEFDKLLKQAAAAADPKENIKLLQEAQQILFKDLPVIPLWYSNVTGGWSKNVDNVVVGWNSVPLYQDIVKTK